VRSSCSCVARSRRARARPPGLLHGDPVAVELTSAIHGGDLDALRHIVADRPELASAHMTGREGLEGGWRTPLHAATDWPGSFPAAPAAADALPPVRPDRRRARQAPSRPPTPGCADPGAGTRRLAASCNRGASVATVGAVRRLITQGLALRRRRHVKPGDERSPRRGPQASRRQVRVGRAHPAFLRRPWERTSPRCHARDFEPKRQS
jgi:hypothetical protein